MSGKARWGALPVAAKAESEEGKKLINDTFSSYKEKWMKNLQKRDRSL
jgi:hypothetical protein